MKRLVYTQPHHLGKLHDELVKAFPSWIQTNPDGSREALFSLSGDGSTVTLWVPDTQDGAAVASVVTAHNPTPLPLPPDRRGFEVALKTIFPDDLLTLRRVLILFWLTEHEEWSRVEKTILALKAANEITSGNPPAQYEQIKAAAAATRIPITLP